MNVQKSKIFKHPTPLLLLNHPQQILLIMQESFHNQNFRSDPMKEVFHNPAKLNYLKGRSMVDAFLSAVPPANRRKKVKRCALRSHAPHHLPPQARLTSVLCPGRILAVPPTSEIPPSVIYRAVTLNRLTGSASGDGFAKSMPISDHFAPAGQNQREFLTRPRSCYGGSMAPIFNCKKKGLRANDLLKVLDKIEKTI